MRRSRRATGAEGGDAAGFGDVVGAVEAVQVYRGVTERRQDLRAAAGVRGVTVLVEGRIAHPVHAVVGC